MSAVYSPTITDEQVTRCARLLDPKWFAVQKGDSRKKVILTVERGFIPMANNITGAAFEAICSMCAERKGKDYDPLRCLNSCPLCKAITLMENATSALASALSKFHIGSRDTEGDAECGGAEGTSPDDGDDGEHNAPVPV